MNILRFPETPRSGDRPGGPVKASREHERPAASADARFLQTLAVLNRPILDAVMTRRPRAQDVLTAFRAEWTPPQLRAPRPANDAPRA